MDLDAVLAELDDNARAALLGAARERRYRAGANLIPEGTVADRIFYLQEGACRSTLDRGGDEVTDFFFFDGDFASDFASLYAGTPSRLNLVALEPLRALELRRDDLLRLGRLHPDIERIGRLTAEYAFVLIEDRMRLLHAADLETRFRWMMRKFPEVFQRVPQHYIATFLGVRPESLSRMKRKVGRDL